MDELTALGKVTLAQARLLHLVQLLLDEILHRLHVVVSHLFYVFYALCVLLREGCVYAAQTSKQRMVKVLQLWQG